MPGPQKRQPRDERLWSKVSIPRDVMTGCWLWMGSTVRGGYGQIRDERRAKYVHRVAYESVVGEIPSGLQLDHLCRVRRCVNPRHLEPVTQKVNVGRGLATKMSDGDAAEARRLYAAGGSSARVLAERFSISPSQIKRLIRHQTRSGTGPLPPRGPSSLSPKLSAADVTAIRASGSSQAALAEKYGVAQSTISRIVGGLRRRHPGETNGTRPS